MFNTLAADDDAEDDRDNKRLATQREYRHHASTPTMTSGYYWSMYDYPGAHIYIPLVLYRCAAV